MTRTAATNTDSAATNTDFAATNTDFAATNIDFAATTIDFAATNIDFAATNTDFAATNTDFAESVVLATVLVMAFTNARSALFSTTRGARDGCVVIRKSAKPGAPVPGPVPDFTSESEAIHELRPHSVAVASNLVRISDKFARRWALAP